MAFRTVFRSSVLVGCNKGTFSAVNNAHAFSSKMMFGRSQLATSMGARSFPAFARVQVLSAQYSTAAENIKKVDYTDMQTLLERDSFVKMKKRLELDQRRNITLQEYQALAAEEGLSPSQAARLLQSLSDSGIVLHFQNSSSPRLQSTVFLRPTELNNTVHHLLEHYSPALLKLQAEATQAEIKDLTQQLAPLTEKRDLLEKKANSRANLIIAGGFGYCVAQFLAIGRLTWWELSWDVMEPVTYMLTFATALIGYSYFVLTGSEYTFEGLKRTLRERRLKKLIRKSGFDEKKFNELHTALRLKENRLHRILDDINHTSSPLPGVLPPIATPSVEQPKTSTAKAQPNKA
jgi:hypothetical protein